MRRNVVAALVAVVVIGAVGYGLYARTASAAAPGTLALAGDVRVDEVVVRAPAITYPIPDYTVGIPTTGTPAPKKRTQPARTVSMLPVVSGYLARVFVADGDHVAKGEVVAQLDTAMLDLGVRQAQTAHDRAAASLDVLDNNLSKLSSTRATLVKTRADLVKTRATLVQTRASLVTTIGILQTQKASLEASITALEQLIGMPGGPPPHVPPYPVILQQLQGALAGLTKGLAGATGGLAQLDAGLAKLDAGLAKLTTGLAKLDSGATQLRGVRKLAAVNVSATEAALELAEAARRQATIVATVDGIVTDTRDAGSAVMVGAPVVRIRPDGPSHIYTYLTADQLELVRVGAAATVTFDSNPGAPIAAHVAYLGDHAEVPPTNFPTSIVHMTRAVRVTLELDGSATAPPGTPVDVVITTGR